MDCVDTKMMHAPYTTKCFPLTATEQNGNVIPSPTIPSPDSTRSTSSLSGGSVETPPDVDMFECLSDGNSVEGDPTCTSPKSSPRGRTLLPPLVKVNRSTTIDIRDPNMALVITDLHNGSCIQQSDNTRCGGGSVDGGSSASSPLLSSARTGTQESFSLPSCCSSSDGSVDWVLRSNSFCLQDSDQPLSFSYLTELAGSPGTPSDLGVPCDALQVQDPGGTPKEDGKHLHLGDDLLSPSNQTYFLDECARPPSFNVPPLAVAPSTFDYATPETCRTGRPAMKLLHSSTRASGQFVTAGDKTFVVSASADREPGNVQTSTPVQSLSDKTLCLPTLNESPFTKEPGDQGSSKADGIKEQPRDGTTKTLAKTAAVAPKVKKFTKPDLSSVKSKIFSRQASTQKSSNVQVVQASPFCSFKRKEDQVQKPSHPMMSKFSSPVSTLDNVSSPSVRPNKIALNKGEAPSSGKQEKPTASHKTLMLPKARPRLWSESSSGPKSKVDDLHQRGKTVPSSFITKVYKAVAHSKAVPQKLQIRFQQGECKGSASSREGALQKKAAEECRSECPKISPKTVCTPKPVVSATGTPAGVVAVSEGRKGRFGAQPLPCRERAALGSPAAQPGTSREAPSMARLRSASNRGLSPSKDSQAANHSKNALNKISGGIGLARSLDATSGVKHSPKRVLPPGTPSRILVQPQGQAKNITRSLQTSSQNTQGYGESCNDGGKAATSKASGLRPRLQTPAKTTTTIAVYRSSTASNPPTVKPVPSTSKKLTTRPARTNTTQPVDKNKQRPSTRSQQQQPVNGHREPRSPVNRAWSVEHYQARCERDAKTIRDLKGLLLGSNRRFEAVSVVLQRCITEHEESLRKCGELSAEMVNLREELANSSQSCKRIEQEKEELRMAFNDTLQKLQEQHRNDLAELEERLRTFYSAEWEKVHQVYQEEADKCKTQMEQQLESLRSKHEVLRKDLEASHADKMESIKQQYEKSFEEFKKAHEEEMQTLDKTLQETENNLTGQIGDLKMENSVLNEKLKAAEDGRMKDMASESPKDSHTLYLEQELESLKVVLDIKNKQLHQQDKKLMELDKVLEKNLKLDECLQKSQQENEDLKARMDKHVTLSRQLSNKQAVLQDSLQKESNVNKRLSMEIEELLWKLQNGDLTSPRKLSPSAPSAPSVSLPSPQNSGIFSSTPVSPR